MTTEKKILFSIIFFTLALIAGSVFWLIKTAPPPKAVLQKTVGAKIEILEQNFDFKEIPINNGQVIHEFQIKNIGDRDLEIANITTSCACSEAFLNNSQGEGPKFSMKGHTPSSDWIGKLSPSEEAQIVAIFDPAFHGPSGIGTISRIVSFETNDPDHPYQELSFKGIVINN